MRLVLLVMSFTLTGCSGGADHSVAPEARQPLIFIAADGLEWSVMEPLVNAGRLPAISGLMATGSYGYLDSMIPTYSPVVWTSIATGKPPAEHGIEHFVYDAGGGQGTRYYTSGHRKTKAFWNILSDYGLTVDLLGWWMTYPAETIHGVMVAQTNTTGVLDDPKRALWKGSLLRGVEGQVTPPERQNEVMDILEETEASFDSLAAAIFGPAATAPMSPFTKLMWDQSRWSFRADAVYTRVAERLLASKEPFDILSVYIGGPDVAGHRFWRYAYPEDFRNPPPPDEAAAFGHVIDDYYIHLDRVVAALQRAAPAGTSVLIVSDHGMHTVNPRGDFSVEDTPENWNSGHHLDAPPGVFIASGPGFVDGTPGDSLAAPFARASLKAIGGVYDVLPTLLALKGIPVGRDFAGRVLTGVLDVSWLERFPVREIDTHDDKAFEAARAARMREAADQAERLEQLKSLGYIR
jgi:Type I phosphodiesterase / nucleotide pyrophosphatase